MRTWSRASLPLFLVLSTSVAFFAGAQQQDKEEDPAIIKREEDQEASTKSVIAEAFAGTNATLDVSPKNESADTFAGAFVGVLSDEIARIDDVGDNVCGVLFKWAAPEPAGRPVFRMNFKTQSGESNWNKEELENDSAVWSVDRTTERVDGGKLQILQIHLQDNDAKVCINHLRLVCGKEVTGSSKRSLVLSYVDWSIRLRDQSQFAHIFWNYQNQGHCMWFSHKRENIKAFDIHAGIFRCDDSDAQCKANNMVIFIN